MTEAVGNPPAWRRGRAVPSGTRSAVFLRGECAAASSAVWQCAALAHLGGGTGSL